MSLMNAELYTALKSAQVPDDQAQAAAQSVVSPEGLATKVDIAELRSEIANLRSELIKWMVGLHAATLLALIGALIAILVRLP